MLRSSNGRRVPVTTSIRRDGTHGHQRLKVEAVFTVVTRLEVVGLTDEIRKIDPQAFIVTQSVSDMKGGLIKKRALH